MTFSAVSRRRFLGAALRAGAGSALVGVDALAALAQQVVSQGPLIVHSARPQDLETPSHLLTSWITPNELFTCARISLRRRFARRCGRCRSTVKSMHR
jgi:hypothetical protein